MMGAQPNPLAGAPFPIRNSPDEEELRQRLAARIAAASQAPPDVTDGTAPPPALPGPLGNAPDTGKALPNPATGRQAFGAGFEGQPLQGNTTLKQRILNRLGNATMAGIGGAGQGAGQWLQYHNYPPGYAGIGEERERGQTALLQQMRQQQYMRPEQEAQVGLQRAQAGQAQATSGLTNLRTRILQNALSGNPDQMIASYGQLSPNEQALWDTGKRAFQMTGNVQELANAAKQIGMLRQPGYKMIGLDANGVPIATEFSKGNAPLGTQQAMPPYSMMGRQYATTKPFETSTGQIVPVTTTTRETPILPGQPGYEQRGGAGMSVGAPVQAPGGQPLIGKAGEAPSQVLSTAVYAEGGLQQMDQAQAAMQRLQAAGAMGNNLITNKLEDWLFGAGLVDPTLPPNVRKDIGILRTALSTANSAMVRAHTNRTAVAIYDDMKKQFGPGQDWNALQGTLAAIRPLLQHYVDAASSQHIEQLRQGQGGQPQQPQKPDLSKYIR